MIESTNPAGSTKQMAQTGCENAVAGVDGILHVANEMSEAASIERHDEMTTMEGGVTRRSS